MVREADGDDEQIPGHAPTRWGRRADRPVPLRLRLLGYQLTPDGYQPLALDEQGRLWLEPVRCWLGIAGGEIVCYDEAGQPLGDYIALSASLRATTADLRVETAARREAEERAEAAEARLRELEAEVRRLRGS